MGTDRERAIDVLINPKTDLESIATINSIVLLLATLHELERARAEREERATLWPVDELPSDADGAVTVGHMRETMALAKRIANTRASVLITGESGTGKEIVARAIHAHSSRASKPFLPFNCAAVPRELLESQLFGYRRGAFTGADRDNPGVIRSARDGTLFLDEIGEMSLDLQPKLLRFLESGEICPLGESTPFPVNVRIVAATNANLEDLVRAGRFREDLFYRLNVIRLSLKPLRERRDEVPALISHFLIRATEEFGKSHIRMAEETMERLILYAWPGNVRQLQNEIRRIVAMADPGSILQPEVLSGDILKTTSADIGSGRRVDTQARRHGRAARRKAQSDPVTYRTRNDQGGAARSPRQGGSRGAGARHLTKGTLPEAPAARPLRATSGPFAPSASQHSLATALRSIRAGHAAIHIASASSGACLREFDSRPCGVTRRESSPPPRRTHCGADIAGGEDGLGMRPAIASPIPILENRIP